MKKIIFYSAAFVLAVGFFMGINLHGIGENAINFEAVDINGNKVKLSDYNNRLVLLDFWATWCPPCRAEIPNLVGINKTFTRQEFVIISVNGFERGSTEEAVKFVKSNNMNWIHIIDKSAARDIAVKYNVQLIPTMYLIKNGKILAEGLRGESLKTKIKELLGK